MHEAYHKLKPFPHTTDLQQTTLNTSNKNIEILWKWEYNNGLKLKTVWQKEKCFIMKKSSASEASWIACMRECVNPFPHTYAFLRLCRRRLLKRLRQKEKSLKSSNVSYCHGHNVFIWFTLKLISTRVRPVCETIGMGPGVFLEHSDLSRTDGMVG